MSSISLAGIAFIVAAAFYVAAVLSRLTQHRAADSKQLKAEREAIDEQLTAELRRERADLMTHRELSSNWSDAWRVRFVEENWTDYEEPAIVLDRAFQAEERVRSGHFKDRARTAGRLLRLTPEDVADLEDMYHREAQELRKQYALVVAKMKKAAEDK